MPTENDKENTVTALRVSAKRRLDYIAKIDRRGLIETAGVIIDEALVRRGIDPETLEPKRGRKK